jgi:hypothetical protein
MRATLALLLLLLTAEPALAITPMWTTITPDQEGSETGGNAIGQGTFTLNDARTELHYHIVFNGLTSNLLGAHIHYGAEGAPGPIWFFLSAGGGTSGTFDGAWTTASTPYGLTPDRVDALLSGLLYVNIHSANYPAGEIRGQILMGPTPTRASTWGRIKRLYR